MVVNGRRPRAENADHGKNSKTKRLLEEHRASERLPIALYILGCAIIGLIATALLTDYTNKDISAEYERV